MLSGKSSPRLLRAGLVRVAGAMREGCPVQAIPRGLLTAAVIRGYLRNRVDTDRMQTMTMSNDHLLETRYFTIGEIARIARVSKMTVYREVHAGKLDSVRIGRSFRIPEESARRWLGGAVNAAA